MKKYNLSSIMQTAWRFFNKGVSTFAVALRMAWANAKATAAAKVAANVSEETHTWYGWKNHGFEVAHESKALYKVTVNDPGTKSGSRVVAYFGMSQVVPLGTQE